MDRPSLFPDAHTEGLDDRVARSWDLSWVLPLPRFSAPCAFCGDEYVLKGWKFHLRQTGTKRPWRCDVRLKCLGCGHVPIFGVPLTEKQYEVGTAANRNSRSGWIEWRQGQRILREAGYFD